MKVSELREMLEGINVDAEIVIAEQLSWPFKYEIVGIWENTKTNEVFIAEGSNLGYLSEDDSVSFQEIENTER